MRLKLAPDKRNHGITDDMYRDASCYIVLCLTASSTASSVFHVYQLEPMRLSVQSSLQARSVWIKPDVLGPGIPVLGPGIPVLGAGIPSRLFLSATNSWNHGRVSGSFGWIGCSAAFFIVRRVFCLASKRDFWSITRSRIS